jgi:hypothetical protein
MLSQDAPGRGEVMEDSLGSPSLRRQGLRKRVRRHAGQQALQKVMKRAERERMPSLKVLPSGQTPLPEVLLTKSPN